MSSIKELFLKAQSALLASRVISINASGKCEYASYGTGNYIGITQRTIHGVDSGVSFYKPGEIAKVTAGGTVTGGDLCYVDNTGSGMVVKYTYTGSSWIPTLSTGDSHYTDAWWSQMRDVGSVVGVAINGTVSGSTFWMLFNPIL